MTGRSIQMLIPANLHQDEARLRSQVQNGSVAYTYDTVRMTKDGRHIDVSVTLSPLKGAAGQIMGTSKIIRDISERKRAQAILQQAHHELEMKVQERTAELKSANRSLRELSGRLMHVQEEERSRLARDLHDEIGQLLTALKIDLQQLRHGELGPGRFGSLTDSLTLVDRLLTQVRNLALDLRPSLLDDLGLVAALRWYANRQAERNGWELSLVVEGIAGRIPVPIEIACFRIAQEALTNVATHASARIIGLTLNRRDQEVTLVIRDDGIGFDVASAQQRAQVGQSIGLLGMEERVRLAGGRLLISSAPGQGCRLELRFPIADDEPVRTDLPAAAVSS
jgi:two-component system sensor histidine kinase UhpB